MKIRCSQCGTKFHYGDNSGICPGCMEYHPWTEEGRVPGSGSRRRFVMWGLGFLGASALLLSPVTYRSQKEAYDQRQRYKLELLEEAQGELIQTVPAGEPVRAGEYYITPGTAFWLPEIDMVGLTDAGGRILVIPVKITANEGVFDSIRISSVSSED